MKITGILLWTQENKLSENFYKKLGFTITHSTESESIVSLNDSFSVTLVNMRDEEQFARDSMTSDKGRGMYIYIRVGSVDDTYAKFLKNGLTPHTKPKDWQWGNREFIIKDPDGYKLCFWQPTSQSR